MNIPIHTLFLDCFYFIRKSPITKKTSTYTYYVPTQWSILKLRTQTMRWIVLSFPMSVIYCVIASSSRLQSTTTCCWLGVMPSLASILASKLLLLLANSFDEIEIPSGCDTWGTLFEMCFLILIRWFIDVSLYIETIKFYNSNIMLSFPHNFC